MGNLAAWGQKKFGDPSKVVHDEFGCTVMQPNRTARLLYYKTYARAAEAAGVGWAVWDDDGWYQVLRRRGNHTWDAEVLAQLVCAGVGGVAHEVEPSDHDGAARLPPHQG